MIATYDKKVTMAERVGIGLDLDPQLAAGYELLQGAMTALEEHDVDHNGPLVYQMGRAGTVPNGS